MDEEKKDISMDEIREKAQAEMDAKAKAIVETAKNPENILNVKLSDTIVSKIENEDTVKTKLNETANTVIKQGLQKQTNVIKTEESKSDLELNKEYYTHFGIENKVTKEWKRKMYSGFVDFWEIVIGIAMGFTIVPISIILDRFRHLQSKWVRGLAIFTGFISLCGLIAGIIFAFIYGIKWVKSLN